METCWTITDEEYFDAPGASALVFHNKYPQGKQGGFELIQHGVRVASCGEARTDPGAGRSPLHSELKQRRADRDRLVVEADLTEQNLGYDYVMRVAAEGDGLRVTVDLPAPLGPDLERRPAFCLELFPPALIGRTWHLDSAGGVLTREPLLPLQAAGAAHLAPPLAVGSRLVLAAGDPERRLVIEARGCTLELIDARRRDFESWLTVATLLPLGRAGRAVDWLVTPNRIAGWRRQPVICVSQIGYHPAQAKRAVIELEPGCEAREAVLVRVDAEAGQVEALRSRPERWGRWLRYDYTVFDFTGVREPGLYLVRYGGAEAGPFRIAEDVFREGVWQPTLECFFPVQMCHAAVRQEQRLWHAACHLDDALQAPTSHEHFDGYRQGPTTDTGYEPGQHIPHLNEGGWHDAGDTDLAAGSQAATTLSLALAHQEFGVETDQTTVLPDERVVRIYQPDGVPDIVQQVAWGARCLLGGYRASGHTFAGIICGEVRQYHQTDEVSAMTDNVVYDPALAPGERTGDRSGLKDDRWAFTSRDSSLEYLVIAALAAAARSLEGHDEALARECLETAVRVWDEEHAREPVEHRSGYVPGHRECQEVLAAVELLVSTREPAYSGRLVELLPTVRAEMKRVGWAVARVLPLVGDEAFAAAFREAAVEHSRQVRELLGENPFGVGFRHWVWGATWAILSFARGAYYLVRAFPDLFDREQVLAAVNYTLGCHPGSNVSTVSGVGTHSLTTAFGINRADYAYEAGGVVSGPSVILPDFPELKEGFPFLWQQSEYVIPGAADWIFCVLAADALLGGPGRAQRPA